MVRPSLISRFFRTHYRSGTSEAKTMANEGSKAVIAVCQMTACDKKDLNLQTCTSLIQSAKRSHAQMVFLPEACDFIGESKSQTLEYAEPLNGPTVQAYRGLARDHSIWLSLGSIHEKVDDNCLKNTHVIIDSEGNIVSTYSKIHLFDVDYPEGGIRLKESSYTEAGQEIVPPIQTPAGRVGMSICYDMRFPELSLCLRAMGADILTFPSAFTFTTGAAHWEVLLRARAIETQCYVVAAAQTGLHNKKRSSWGRAMIIDPWGSVIAQCSEGANVAVAEIDLSYLLKTRMSMPVSAHRRRDLYPTMKPLLFSVPKENSGAKSYRFGQTSVQERAVFFKSNLTIAFVNKKCVVPGHVLIAPIRCVQHFGELTAEEVADLFQVVHRIQGVIVNTFKGTAATIAIQDGKDAGQTIQHVHVHLLPRRVGDFPENDEIYRRLQKHDKDPNEAELRTEDEMAEEANMLRKLF